MSVATIAPTIDPYPNGLDQTMRRTILYGSFTFPASPAFYTTGGLPFSLAAGVASPIAALDFSNAAESGCVLEEGQRIRLSVDHRGLVAAEHCGCRRPSHHRFQRQFAGLHHGGHHQ